MSSHRNGTSASWSGGDAGGSRQVDVHSLRQHIAHHKSMMRQARTPPVELLHDRGALGVRRDLFDAMTLAVPAAACIRQGLQR